MKEEYKQYALILAVAAITIYLLRDKDEVLDSATIQEPSKTGENGGFENWVGIPNDSGRWTEDDFNYDDGLQKNFAGRSGLKGLKF